MHSKQHLGLLYVCHISQLSAACKQPNEFTMIFALLFELHLLNEHRSTEALFASYVRLIRCIQNITNDICTK